WNRCSATKASRSDPGQELPGGASSDPLQPAEEEIAFDPGIFIAVAAVDGILTYRSGKELADRSRIGLRRIGCPDQLAEIGHGILLLQDRRNDGTTAHKIHQLAIERPRLMHGIKLPRFFLRKPRELHRRDCKTTLEDHIDDSTRMPLR